MDGHGVDDNPRDGQAEDGVQVQGVAAGGGEVQRVDGAGDGQAEDGVQVQGGAA